MDDAGNGKRFLSAFTTGVGFIFYVLVFIFVGYTVGIGISKSWGMLGIVAGAFTGFLLVIIRISKLSERI